MSNCTRIYKANMHFTDFCVIYDIVESLCDKPLEDGPQDPHVIADIMMMPWHGTLSTPLALCEGNPPVSWQGTVIRTFDFFFFFFFWGGGGYGG